MSTSTNGAAVDYDAQFEDALGWLVDTGGEDVDHGEVANSVGKLVRQLAVYRGRAAYWQAKAEGKDEVIGFLRRRVEQLEGRRDGPAPSVPLIGPVIG